MNRLSLSILISLLVPLHAFSQQKVVRYRIPVELRAHHSDMNVLDGGRTNSVAVNPDPMHRNELFAASDSGGLFKSITGGATWTHVDGLPVHFTQSIVYLDSDSLLVSAKADFKAQNGGGVWRSDDGGTHWTQLPLSSPDQTTRLSAYEISVDGNDIVVGTTDGIYLSRNGGSSWTFSDPYATLLPPLNTHLPLYSVLVSAGRIFAGGPSGIRLGTVALDQWRWPSIEVVPVWSIHAFQRSPVATDQAFVAAGGALLAIENGGQTWRDIPGRHDTDICGGAPFVKAVRRAGMLDLYFGTTCTFHRFSAPVSGTTVDYASGAWQDLEVERDDRPRDLALADPIPVLLATNGGIQNTTDTGLNWHFIGGGTAGYNAFQIPDLKGQFTTGVDPDLYAATRDNFFWSADAAANIGFALPHEAFLVDLERQLATGGSTRVTWAKNDPVSRRRAGLHLSGDSGWNDAPHQPNEAQPTAPVLIQGDRYVQRVESGLDLTPDAGSHWQRFAMFPEEPRGLSKLGRGKFGRVIFYQTFKSNLAGPPAEGATRLMRIADAGGTGSVVYPAMAGTGNLQHTIGLGVVRTPVAMYPLYGVDPRNAFHVIAPDIINDTMIETTNGGEEWHELPALRDLVTRGGTLLMHADLPDAEAAPLVTAVSFSPADPSLVLVGTREGGIYMSGDRGLTWSRITNSELIPWVTSFFWADANTIFLSTYGRGLWKLQNTQFILPGAFGQVCGGCQVMAKEGTPDPRFDDSLLVFDGSILGVRTEKDVLREVYVTPGSSVVFTGDEKDRLDEITITRSDGKETGEPLPKGPDGFLAVGVVFATDHTLAGAAFAKAELSLLPPEVDDDGKGSTDSPTKGMPYLRLTGSAFNGVTTVEPKEEFTLSGTDFAAGASYDVLLDGVTVLSKLTADGNGSLSARLSAPSVSGYHRVEVRDSGKGIPVEGSVFLVNHPR